jgi:hypothetical protein
MTNKKFFLSKSVIKILRTQQLKKPAFNLDFQNEMSQLNQIFTAYFNKYNIQEEIFKKGIFIIHYVVSKLDLYENKSQKPEKSISNKHLVPQELYQCIIKNSQFFSQTKDLESHEIQNLDLEQGWAFTFSKESDLTISQFYYLNEQESIVDLIQKEEERSQIPVVSFDCFLIKIIFECLDVNFFNCARCIKFKLENKLLQSINLNGVDENLIQYSSIIQNPPDIKDFFNEFKSMVLQCIKKTKRSSEMKKFDSSFDNLTRSNALFKSQNLESFEKKIKRNNSSFFPKIYSNIYEFLIQKLSEIIR